MKHIKETLAERQTSLFDRAEEKGSGEWKIFSAVRGDSIGAYRVTLPRRPVVVREPHHVLRIVYPQHLRAAH